MRYSENLLTLKGSERSHPSEDDLEEFVFGRLQGAELDELEEHLLLCEDCRRRLTETETFVASTRAAARKMLGAPPPTPKPRRFSAPALAWAGALAGLLIVGVLIGPWFQTLERVDLVAERGTLRGEASAGHPLDLRLESSGIEPRWLEIVDSRGKRLYASPVSVTNGYVIQRSPALPQGQAWIRLYTQTTPQADTVPLREYSLSLR